MVALSWCPARFDKQSHILVIVSFRAAPKMRILPAPNFADTFKIPQTGKVVPVHAARIFDAFGYFGHAQCFLKTGRNADAFHRVKCNVAQIALGNGHVCTKYNKQGRPKKAAPIYKTSMQH